MRPVRNIRECRGRVAGGSLLAALLALFVSVGSPTSYGNTAAVTVTATIPSATYISVDPADSAPAGNCKTATARTQIGTVLPGQGRVSAQDCSVVFGSSNDTSMLKVFQQDGSGKAMWSAQPRPDLSWAGGDAISDRVDGGSNLGDTESATLLLPDGDFLVGGTSTQAGSGGDFVLVRYNADGSKDTTWGGGDAVSDRVDAGGSNGGDSVYGIHRLSDGGFLATGYGFKTGTGFDYVAVKYDSNGSKDNTWGGGDGISDRVDAGGSNSSDTATSSLLLADGSFILAGHGRVGATNDIIAVKYDANGSKDNTWGGGDGISDRVDPTGQGRSDAVWSSKLLPDGSFYVAGNPNKLGTDLDFGYVKFTANGALDTSWGGGDGVSDLIDVAGLSAADYSTDSNLLPDGSMILTGQVLGSGWDMAAVKYQPNGSVDLSYGGGDGISVLIDAGGFGGTDSSWSSHALDDGSVFLAGYGTKATGSDLAVAKLTPSGAIDQTYSSTGVAELVDATGTNGADTTASSLMLPDGEIVVAGTTANGAAGNDIVAVKFDSVGVDPYKDDGTADWDTVGSLDLFGACLRDAANGATVGGSTWGEDPDGDCADGDSDPWKPIVATAGLAGAKVAESTTIGDGDATAHLRFGFRAEASQARGTYYAPVTFEVIAPNSP
jgi:uncharacterized delta-60 repeat protein